MRALGVDFQLPTYQRDYLLGVNEGEKKETMRVQHGLPNGAGDVRRRLPNVHGTFKDATSVRRKIADRPRRTPVRRIWQVALKFVCLLVKTWVVGSSLKRF